MQYRGCLVGMRKTMRYFLLLWWLGTFCFFSCRWADSRTAFSVFAMVNKEMLTGMLCESALWDVQ